MCRRNLQVHFRPAVVTHAPLAAAPPVCDVAEAGPGAGVGVPAGLQVGRQQQQ